MSEYATIQTEFRDAEALVCALTRVPLPSGKTWTREQIERHGQPAALHDFMGKIREDSRAHLIVRRKHVSTGASNDLGFCRQANGLYRMLISDFDEAHKGYDKNWQNRLKQEYALAALEQQAHRHGLQVSATRHADGRIVGNITGYR